MDQFIEIKGAKEHNLKNVSAKIPKNKLVVLAGPSGSGKSTFAMVYCKESVNGSIWNQWDWSPTA
ncbi:ATP-binding cassette domain-containing protein [Methanohalophilus sp. RSK]|uniref:ATP-binding cassette domain-containing protein n=1 Tax=Methanohalophilus sp. RSK TaxID=2485783 RepID=UPI0018F37C14